MRILMLSWAYPPVDVDGHGDHAHVLARDLVAAGHEVHVVTRWHGEGPEPTGERLDGVHVVRVAEAPPVIPMTDRVPAALSFNSRAQAAGTKLVRRVGADVLHVHDRLAAYAATGLREAYGLPIVATVHAPEVALHPGLPDDVSKLVHQVEWWLTYEARRVISCSTTVHDQLRDHFRLPVDKLDVIPAAPTTAPAAPDPALRRTVSGPRTKVVLLAGRVDERGLDAALAALPAVRDEAGPTRLVVAARGVGPDAVRRRARDAGLRHHVVSVEPPRGVGLARLVAVADATVVLGDDDPCGSTVVTAMAAGSAVVVGPDAGLAELVARAGIALPRVTPAALRTALRRAVADPARHARLGEAARARAAARHDGPTVAAATAAVYERAIAEERELAGATRPPLRPILRSAPILELDGTA
jgi:glycogen synthase